MANSPLKQTIKELDARDGGACVADTLLYRVPVKDDSRATLNSTWYLPTLADDSGSEVGIGNMQTGTCEVATRLAFAV